MVEKFKLTKEQKDKMVSLIKLYFYEERGEELGDLAAGLVLGFFMDKLAPEFYNIGIFDAHRYINEKAEELLELQKY